MNRYLVDMGYRWDPTVNQDMPVRKLIEADRMLITANGDLKFAMKSGLTIHAVSSGRWDHVELVEDNQEDTGDTLEEGIDSSKNLQKAES